MKNEHVLGQIDEGNRQLVSLGTEHADLFARWLDGCHSDPTVMTCRASHRSQRLSPQSLTKKRRFGWEMSEQIAGGPTDTSQAWDSLDECVSLCLYVYVFVSAIENSILYFMR